MKDTFYFSHDYNSRNDTKLVEVMMTHWLVWIWAFWCIVEMLYEEWWYLPLKYERITFELRTDKNVVQSIINDFWLFENDGEKFWSNSIIDRLKQRQEKSEKAKQSIQKRWDKQKDTNVLRTKNESNTIKERKGKKRKGKESKDNNISIDIETKVSDAPKQYWNKDITNTLSFLMETIWISDFKETKEKQRQFWNHIFNLWKKIGKEDFLKRLNGIMNDSFKKKNCNSIKYLYWELKSYIINENVWIVSI